MLRNLERWLDKAEAHATSKGFDVKVLLESRLAPDQFALTRQIQVACDSAKSGAASLAGKTPPKHPDDEQTLDELRARIKKVLDYLETFNEADFEGAETRAITLSFMPGKVIEGRDYLHEMSLPNFYFHLATAYSILRHNGVDVGKNDFIGHLSLRPA